MIEFNLADESATLNFGSQFAAICPATALIFLQGNLGAGKTTFVRGFLQGLSYSGKVKSPTYTLVEPYEINGKHIFHFDLYRLNAPSELENIGIQDYLATPAIILIEWPERASNMLPNPDISIELKPHGTGRQLILAASSNLESQLSRSL